MHEKQSISPDIFLFIIVKTQQQKQRRSNYYAFLPSISVAPSPTCLHSYFRLSSFAGFFVFLFTKKKRKKEERKCYENIASFASACNTACVHTLCVCMCVVQSLAAVSECKRRKRTKNRRRKNTRYDEFSNAFHGRRIQHTSEKVIYKYGRHYMLHVIVVVDIVVVAVVRCRIR